MSGIDDTCVLRARGLRKQYGREAGLVHAVDGLDLDVAAGQTPAVMGPSGCGKSTLLHLLGGLDRPTAGELFFEDRRPPHPDRRRARHPDPPAPVLAARRPAGASHPSAATRTRGRDAHRLRPKDGTWA